MIAPPDERAVREHFRSGRFVAGIDAGQWRLISLDWPIAMIEVAAAERPHGPKKFVLRFELSGYPHTAPTGGIWDVDAHDSLPPDRRPKGQRAAQLFRFDGWTGGATAMYAPWDRAGLQAHPEWAQTYSFQAWNPTRDLSFVLSQVHEVLTADDYLGV